MAQTAFQTSDGVVSTGLPEERLVVILGAVRASADPAEGTDMIKRDFGSKLEVGCTHIHPENTFG